MRINKKWLLIIFIICAVSIIGAIGVVHMLKSSNSSSGEDVPEGMPTQREISIEEIKKHNSASDCWTIIGGMVFDASNVIASNAAYTDYLIKACGTNGTAIYTVQKYSEQPLERQTIVQLREQLGKYQLGMFGLE